MSIDRGARYRWRRRVRLVAALLAALIIGMPLGSTPATAAARGDLPSRQGLSPDRPAAPDAGDRRPGGTRSPAPVVPNQVTIQAKSGFEQIHNPFGDEWSTKTGASASIPVGLTPVCHRQTGKPDATESLFLSRSNSPFIFQECADLPDVSVPDSQGNRGSVKLKEVIAAVKAQSSAVRYIGYFQMPRADTQTAGAGGATIGVTFIHQNREDWFVHINGASPTSGNRVKWENGVSDLFDITNPDFRAFMVTQLVASMVHHDLDGFVLADCLDQPQNSPSTPVPPNIAANWEAGCNAMLQATKAALDPIGKLVFTQGYDHIGTRGSGSIVNEAAAFSLFSRRMDITHGLFWEDPFRATTASAESAEGSFARYKLVRDYAVARGKYVLHTNNTFEGNQSTFANTNAGQQRLLARYYLAQFLAAMSPPFTVMHHYFPTSQGPQFVSDAYYREWDLKVGVPTGADTKPASAVFQREFRYGRVVANLSSNPFTVSLSDAAYTDFDGQAVGGSAVVPAKSGAVFLRAQPTVTCTPRPRVNLTTTNLGSGQIRVDVAATGTAGNNTLQSIRFLPPTNAEINFGVQSKLTGTFTLTLPNETTQTSFTIRRTTGAGMAGTSRFTVIDGCGDWLWFAGLGAAVP